MLRRLYDWVLRWADSPHGTWALFLLAFCEASFFPIPPDVLLIALAVGRPVNSYRYALVCTAGSVLGGMVGYFIGWQFMAAVGQPIIGFYGLTDRVADIRHLYQRYDAWAIAVAGFTPIPYKVFTISAGAFAINFAVFLTASALSRAARFLLVGALIYFFGPSIRSFIDRYFNLLAVTFTVLLIAGFILIRYIF